MIFARWWHPSLNDLFEISPMSFFCSIFFYRVCSTQKLDSEKIRARSRFTESWKRTETRSRENASREIGWSLRKKKTKSHTSVRSFTERFQHQRKWNSSRWGRPELDAAAITTRSWQWFCSFDRAFSFSLSIFPFSYWYYSFSLHFAFLYVIISDECPR